MSIRRRAENRLGWTVTRVPRVNSLPWMLKRVFRLYGVDHVIDVGANVGEFASETLRRAVRFRGSVASVEPAGDSFEHLMQRARRDDSWHCYRFALGPQAGTSTLFRHGGPDHDSLLQPSDFGRERFGYGLAGEPHEQVAVRTLDGAWDDLVPRSDATVFLKTDAQGFDLPIVRAAGPRLSSVAGVLIEVESKPTYDGSPHLTEVVRSMNEMGFDEVGFFPVARVKADGDLRLVTSDAVFVRRP